MPLNAALKRLGNDPTDRQLERLWKRNHWRRVGDVWVTMNPTVPAAACRIALQRAKQWCHQHPAAPAAARPLLPTPAPDPHGPWVALLDGTACQERDGNLMLWDDRYVAALDLLRMVDGKWHGPALRFRTGLPWCRPLDEDLVRPLLTGEAVVVRPWEWPVGDCLSASGTFLTCWGVFLTQRGYRPLALRTIGNRDRFDTEQEAMAAADREVGRWVRSAEWDLHHLPVNREHVR